MCNSENDVLVHLDWSAKRCALVSLRCMGMWKTKLTECLKRDVSVLTGQKMQGGS